MTVGSWLLYAVTAALALAATAYVYLRREPPGPGRAILVALRFLVLAGILLLLFDPHLPARGARSGRTMVLLDGSLSMALPTDPAAPRGETRWRRAVAEARRAAGRAPVLLFGDAPRPVRPDSLPAAPPGFPDTRLLPALQAASEAGAGRALVLTDGGTEDADEVARWIPRLGLDVEVRTVARGGVPDVALPEVTAPPWAQAGKPFTIEATIASTGDIRDSVTVVVRQEGRVLAQRRMAPPQAGRSAPAPLAFTPAAPAGGGLVRYDVAVIGRDAVPDDDERSVYVFVSERPTGVAVVSFHPDWEPRFLQPVLEDALGLPARGFLMPSPGRYVTMGTGAESGQAATETQVREAVAQAEVVVLHAIGADAPGWAQATARVAQRVILFPAGDATQLGLPVTLPPAVPGEWYVSPQVPSSPVAPLLTGIAVEGAPPLTALRPTAVPPGAWAPLMATRGRSGAPAPLALAGEAGGRRWVVATGEGYWQWAFRGGAPRDIYQRLWGSVAGWLIRERRPLAAAAVRPADRVVPRGQPVLWLAQGLAADSIALHVTADAGGLKADTVLPLARGDSATSRALVPGHYHYAARAFAGGKPVATAEGPFTVERYSPEFLRPLLPASAFAAATPLGPGASEHGQGTPLHATPWPWALIVLLLVAEWVLRRRWGLR